MINLQPQLRTTIMTDKLDPKPFVINPAYQDVFQELCKKIEALESQLATEKETLASLEKIASEPQYPTMVDIPRRSYALADAPVTVAQYEHFCDETSREKPHRISDNLDTPVVNVNYHDANAYCKWLSEVTGDQYELPSEDEWEYCCADHLIATPEIAVYESDTIQPIKTKQANKFGLYDMLGNVREWTK